MAGTPIAGAVITLLDSTNATIVRGLSLRSGEFTAPRPPRTLRARIVRIGYRPRDIVLPWPPAGDLEIQMLRVPAMLEQVEVTGESRCPKSADGGRAFALWEQARDGLLASVVARQTKPAFATTLTYQREYAGGSKRLEQEITRRDSGQTSRPFAAVASPRSFVVTGYMIEDAGSRTYFAPDADVLLDDTFEATHCFSLEPSDSAHPGEVGVAFAPIPGDTLVNVAGTIWMDAGTPQLRRVVFKYTRLEPAALAFGAGGRISFQTVSSGVTFVDRWSLRLPVLGTATTADGVERTDMIASLRREDRTDLRVQHVREIGGDVLRARWADGTVWEADGAREIALTTSIHGPIGRAQTRTIIGTVRDSTGNAVGSASVHLIAGPTVITDNSGRFRLVTPGDEPLTLEVQRIGYTAALVQVAGGMDTTIALRLDKVPVQLERVVTQAQPSTAGLSGFDTRLAERARGTNSGFFITPAEIEQRRPWRASQLFEGLPGVTLIQKNSSATRFAITTASRTFGSNVCVITIYVDGVRVLPEGDGTIDIDALVNPTEIAGIEYYPSGNRAPPAYQPLNGTCGVALVWTK
ncbi:MAG TPA: carboxypeptidase regulatory-like domain-containing protein [Gemmatimonadaceae bacterium]|nr:carboxypeptidase regulatory-like domain-containing protein [Gemmatimonadaceae bacterium]